MKPTDPQDLDWVSILIAIFLGTCAAALNFLRRDLKRLSAFKKIQFLVLDMFMFLTLTLLVWIGLAGYGLNDLLSLSIAGLVGHYGAYILGHYGARGLYIVELIIAERLGAKKTFDTIKKEKKNKKDSNV